MTQLKVAIPSSAAPVGPFFSNYLFSRTIAANLVHRALLRRRRHREQVTSDYESGEWAQQRAARNWQTTSSLEDYADKTWVNRAIVAEMDGRLWRVHAPDYYNFRRRKLIEILSEYDCGADTLIELGSGTGSNLFALATSPRWQQLVGLELSETGRAVTRDVREYFDLSDRIAVDHIDLLDRSSPGFAHLRGAVVFTHYCLEQLPDHTEEVFRGLVGAGVRRAIFIEPSFELLSRRVLKDQASRTYVLRQDYQRSIIRCAEKLQSEGLVSIVSMQRLDFVSSCRNAPTLLVWDTTPNSTG